MDSSVVAAVSIGFRTTPGEIGISSDRDAFDGIVMACRTSFGAAIPVTKSSRDRDCDDGVEPVVARRFDGAAAVVRAVSFGVGAGAVGAASIGVSGLVVATSRRSATGKLGSGGATGSKRLRSGLGKSIVSVAADWVASSGRSDATLARRALDGARLGSGSNSAISPAGDACTANAEGGASARLWRGAATTSPRAAAEASRSSIVGSFGAGSGSGGSGRLSAKSSDPCSSKAASKAVAQMGGSILLVLDGSVMVGKSPNRPLGSHASATP